MKGNIGEVGKMGLIARYRRWVEKSDREELERTKRRLAFYVENPLVFQNLLTIFTILTISAGFIGGTVIYASSEGRILPTLALISVGTAWLIVLGYLMHRYSRKSGVPK